MKTTSKISTTSKMKMTTTRTELPSCEAIDGKKVNIAYIVLPVTKLKVGVIQRLLSTLNSYFIKART